MATQRQVEDESSDHAPTKKATSMLVKVTDSRDGHLLTNVRLPIGIMRWGMKMASLFTPEMRDANIDWEAVGALLQDGAEGEIVHVEDEEKHQIVEVWVQ